MHPTPDEQLRAAQRTLDQVSVDPSLAPGAREALDDVRRMLRRLEASWAQRLPFLLLDNRLAMELLRSIAPHVPDLVAEIESADADVTSSGRDGVNEPAAHDLNKRLQALLGRAVHCLPDDADGDAGRSRIAAHVRARLAADPALNRTPTHRLSSQEPNA